jgi:hypothetical protein
MSMYCVNNKAQSNGDHEVHTYSCQYLPSDRTYLGDFASCVWAVVEAKKKYTQSNGCATCCSTCHTS